jgi:hypothetical protein
VLIDALPRSSSAHTALSVIGSDEAFKALVQELSTSHPRRLEAAAKALEQIGDPQALPHLKAVPATDDALAAWALSSAIGRLEAIGAGPIQFRRLTRTSATASRTKALLGLLPEEVRPKLEKLKTTMRELSAADRDFVISQLDRVRQKVDLPRSNVVEGDFDSIYLALLECFYTDGRDRFLFVYNMSTGAPIAYQNASVRADYMNAFHWIARCGPDTYLFMKHTSL